MQTSRTRQESLACNFPTDWQIVSGISSIDKERAKLHFDDLIQSSVEKNCNAILDQLNAYPNLGDFLTTVLDLSPYLRDIMVMHPHILQSILERGLGEHFFQTLDEVKSAGLADYSDDEFMQHLRMAKKSVALLCALADLGGWWHPSIVINYLSQFADTVVQAAFDHILKASHNAGSFTLDNKEKPQAGSGVFALAMGKHGAHELNYSSDIDLILFFHQRAEEKISGTDPGTFFLRFAKKLVRLLQERTADGYVFRTDLRLRPDPSSTPPVMPLEAGLIYYESQGQNWERAAMIKARPIVGDQDAAEEFMKAISPFVWRKNLDFAAINDVHSIKRQIHAHKGHSNIAAHGHNIKLGRGGIREIEFFVQTQQLIAGGRIPKLRTISTIDGLNELREQGWIAQLTQTDMTECYWYLRNVEHRLQMVRDEQTHTLPVDELEFQRIAKMMGCEDSEQFEKQLLHHLATVERHYASLFEDAPQLSSQMGNLIFTGDEDDPHTLETLSNLGFERPSGVVKTVRSWHFGRYPSLRTTQAKELLTEITPSLLEAIASTGKPDEGLNGFDRFIAGLPAGIQLFSLIKANPQLLDLLVLILGSAPRLAKIITRNPDVFDSLIDPAFANTMPDTEQLQERLTDFLKTTPDYEMKLDRARKFASEQKFLIGVRLITGSIDAQRAGVAFSELAAVLINTMQALVLDQFSQSHGHIEKGQVGVLGMGRLGSAELTAGSDLDLIFLYRHDEACAYSDGEKPLATSVYFSRLTQRLISAMSAPTAQGIIYELDFRLRPSGNAGPLATEVGSFFKYQYESAWTWEHQALTRARMVAGSKELSVLVQKEIAAILSKPQDDRQLGEEISAMRQRIYDEKGSTNPFDCKNVRGGIIDIEFIAQFLVLSQGRAKPEAPRQTVEVIANSKHELLSEEMRVRLCDASKLYNTVIQILRTCMEGDFVAASADEGIKKILCIGCDCADIGMLEEELVECQESVAQIFTALMDAAKRG